MTRRHDIREKSRESRHELMKVQSFHDQEPCQRGYVLE
jgi:hypothetical protein